MELSAPQISTPAPIFPQTRTHLPHQTTRVSRPTLRTHTPAPIRSRNASSTAVTDTIGMAPIVSRTRSRSPALASPLIPTLHSPSPGVLRSPAAPAHTRAHGAAMNHSPAPPPHSRSPILQQG